MAVALEQGIDERILALIGSMPGCKIDDVVDKAPDLTWNRVFAEIDRLSRTGGGAGDATAPRGVHAYAAETRCPGSLPAM